MSCSKADTYYEAHVDDEWCTECESDDLPDSVAENHHDWRVKYMEPLWELYRCFKRDGSQLFGNAHFQNGTFFDFASFVERFTLP